MGLSRCGHLRGHRRPTAILARTNSDAGRRSALEVGADVPGNEAMKPRAALGPLASRTRAWARLRPSDTSLAEIVGYGWSTPAGERRGPRAALGIGQTFTSSCSSGVIGRLRAGRGEVGRALEHGVEMRRLLRDLGNRLDPRRTRCRSRRRAGRPARLPRAASCRCGGPRRGNQLKAGKPRDLGGREAADCGSRSTSARTWSTAVGRDRPGPSVQSSKPGRPGRACRTLCRGEGP